MARCANHNETACITSTLLEFLYLLVEEYAPQMRDQMRSNIRLAHSELLDKKVIRTVGEYKVQDDRIQNYTEYLFSGASLKLLTERYPGVEDSNRLNSPVVIEEGSIETSNFYNILQATMT